MEDIGVEFDNFEFCIDEVYHEPFPPNVMVSWLEEEDLVDIVTASWGCAWTDAWGRCSSLYPFLVLE